MNKISLIPMSAFLRSYSNIRMAGPSDNLELLNFIKKIKLKTMGAVLAHNRGDNFFNYANMVGEYSYILIFENQDKSIGGFGMLSKKRVFVDGNLETVGYLTDIRIAETLSRQTRIQWRKLYGDFLLAYRNIEEFHDCKTFYSVIMGDNQPSLNAFAQGKRGVLYNPICSFSTINVLFKLNPFKKKNQVNGFTVSRACENDFSDLRIFLYNENRMKNFGENFQPHGSDEMIKRLNNWSRLELSSFILVKDYNNQIVACVAPCKISEMKAFHVEVISMRHKLLNLMRLFWGASMIKTDQILEVVYLTSLEVCSNLSLQKRKQIFLLMFDFLYKMVSKESVHMFCFNDYRYNDFKTILKEHSYFLLESPGNIYEVSSTQITSSMCWKNKRISHEVALS